MTADLVPLLALVALIVVAYRHPRWWVEALAAVVAAGAVLTTDALDVHGARSEIDRLGPVVIFLVAILTVAESCRANGLFEAVGARLRRLSGRDAVLGVTFATAAAVTVTLSLDATIVLLTPVVLTATRNRFVAGEMACVCLANSASLLVPVANLTNLLMMPHLHLTFGRFALLMAPSWFVVLIVEFVALRIVARHEPVSAPEPVARDGGPSPVRALPVEQAYVALQAEDPARAAALGPRDTTRIARALEVVRSTGRPLADWQAQRVGGIGEAIALHPLILLPPREPLYARCDARFARMLEQGAIEEVEVLLLRHLSPSLPVMRAIGVPEIAGYLRGEWSKEEALARGQQATRNYAKRQYTWFRRQPSAQWPRCESENCDVETYFETLFSF